MYLNFHTHFESNSEDVTDFYNIDLKKGPAEFNKGCFRCLGIHPWDVKPEIIDRLDSFAFVLEQADVLCLGEIGLDRVTRKSDFNIQKEVFLFQLDIAAKRGDPFIVLHCVKAYNDILECVAKSKYRGKLVFHDYNGNQIVTKDLVSKGHYFSYGNMLFFPSSKGHKALKDIPIEKLFIETDEHKHFTIEQAYEKVSELKNIDLPELSSRIFSNFKELQS